MTPTKLHLIDSEEPTPAEVYQARLEQSWREWSPQGWKPIEIDAENPLDVGAIQQRSYKVIVVPDSPVPWYRRMLRWRMK
jgi:hypothetical protein